MQQLLSGIFFKSFIKIRLVYVFITLSLIYNVTLYFEPIGIFKEIN